MNQKQVKNLFKDSEKKNIKKDVYVNLKVYQCFT